MTAAPPHDYPIGIDPPDIDFMGRVNNASYLKWVQEAVLSHWRRLAPPEAVAQHLWVALKHEITYRQPTFIGDEVLAEISSSWCSVDATTLRPARLARDVIDSFFGRDEQSRAG